MPYSVRIERCSSTSWSRTSVRDHRPTAPRHNEPVRRTQPAALVGVRGRPRGERDGPDGRDDRQRRRSVDPARARRQRLYPAVAERRLHARVRRLPDHRRATWGHVRPTPTVPDRLRGLHPDVRRLRRRPLAVGADRLPSSPGQLRSADDPPGFRDAQGVLRRGRDEQGLRRLRADDGTVHARRTDSRRSTGRGEPVGDRVAAGVPDQRPDRNRHVRRGHPSAAPDGRPPRNQARHRRDGPRRTGADRDHLPTDSRPRGRLASLDVHHARRRSGTARRVRSLGAPLSWRSADRTRTAGQPHIHQRDPRSARVLRCLRRTAAVRVTLRPAWRRASRRSTQA